MERIRLPSTSALLLILLCASKITWALPAGYAEETNIAKRSTTVIEDLPQVNSSTTVQPLEAPPLEAPLETQEEGVESEPQESTTAAITTTKNPNEESVLQQLLHKMPPGAELSQSPYQGR
ncbi:hypothetical protein DdX_15967 [Ditylenchus destructor]|uniref:Uncharacterized protein n=1 Tax=Ditylenchus destructor TaxID=166010 RepID=A0AAD4R0F9_9BILA|nr:hypothetical protein DdX_15967 [Ditylenchus destructor]